MVNDHERKVITSVGFMYLDILKLHEKMSEFLKAEVDSETEDNAMTELFSMTADIIGQSRAAAVSMIMTLTGIVCQTVPDETFKDLMSRISSDIANYLDGDN